METPNSPPPHSDGSTDAITTAILKETLHSLSENNFRTMAVTLNRGIKRALEAKDLQVERLTQEAQNLRDTLVETKRAKVTAHRKRLEAEKAKQEAEKAKQEAEAALQRERLQAQERLESLRASIRDILSAPTPPEALEAPPLPQPEAPTCAFCLGTDGQVSEYVCSGHSRCVTLAHTSCHRQYVDTQSRMRRPVQTPRCIICRDSDTIMMLRITPTPRSQDEVISVPDSPPSYSPPSFRPPQTVFSAQVHTS